MALGAPEYTELVASTLAKIETDLVDQVLTKHPTLDLFNSQAKSDTGRALVMNLIAADDESTTLTDASGSFDTGLSPDVIGAAEYEWSSPVVSKVRRTFKELEMNSGKHQIIDLVKTHIEAAKRGQAKKIAQLLHNLASGNQAGQFESFDRIVANSTYETANGNFTVGKIDPPDDNHYWNAVRRTIGTTTQPSLLSAFRTLENDLTVSTSAASTLTHIIAGRDVYEEYVAEMDDKVRYVFPNSGDAPEGNRRFQAVWFGNCEVRLDPDCPANRAYFLDINTWAMRYLNGNFMKVQPAQTVTGTLDFITPIASVIAVGTNERRANGLLIRDAS